MGRPLEIKSKTAKWALSGLLLTAALVLLSTGIAAAADWHPQQDQNCLLCQLRVHTAATEISVICLPAPAPMSWRAPDVEPGKEQVADPAYRTSRSPPSVLSYS
jgi:hypothetical protein